MAATLPATVAGRLRAETFALWSPAAVFAAVTERVLVAPDRCDWFQLLVSLHFWFQFLVSMTVVSVNARRSPALGAAPLHLIHTRFVEHDFSLAAAKRAVHLFTLDHFLTEPLSALGALTASPAAFDDVIAAACDGMTQESAKRAHVVVRALFFFFLFFSFLCFTPSS